MGMMPQSAARAMQLGLLARDLARVKRGANAAKARAHLVERLGKLHGLPQKIGQILSLNELDDAEPVFTPLTEGEAVLSPETAFAAIEEELGRPVDELFRSIEPKGIAASLSQVHRAQLHDGRHVAVKVQYPNIQDAIWLDLKALGWITAPVGGLNRGFDLAGYQAEVKNILGEELDYCHEAETLRAFHGHVVDWPDVAVPEVIPELSGERILTMTWIEGGPPAVAHDWTSAQRHTAGRTLLRLFIASSFKWHCVHGDPHPGNLRFRISGGQPIIGLLDFGCTKPVDGEISGGIRALIDMTIAGTLQDARDDVYTQYLRIGFNPDLLEPMAAVLPKLTEALFAPFAHAGPYNIASWGLGEKVSSILGEHRMSFRTAGPAHLIVFLRAYQGLIHYLKFLNVSINWQHTYGQILDVAKVPAKPTVPIFKIPEGLGDSGCLRIRVLVSGRQKAAITFRASCAAFLHELLPDDVNEKLVKRGIDVAAIEAAAVKSNFAPGELFALTEGTKEIRVWLD